MSQNCLETRQNVSSFLRSFLFPGLMSNMDMNMIKRVVSKCRCPSKLEQNMSPRRSVVLVDVTWNSGNTYQPIGYSRRTRKLSHAIKWFGGDFGRTYHLSHRIFLFSWLPGTYSSSSMTLIFDSKHLVFENLTTSFCSLSFLYVFLHCFASRYPKKSSSQFSWKQLN